MKDPQASTANWNAYESVRYHQMSDKYDPKWDLGGMVQQAQFTLNLGRKVADGQRMPAWKAGDAFGRVCTAKQGRSIPG